MGQFVKAPVKCNIANFPVRMINGAQLRCSTLQTPIENILADGDAFALKTL
jgi:hypothetical protein